LLKLTESKLQFLAAVATIGLLSGLASLVILLSVPVWKIARDTIVSEESRVRPTYLWLLLAIVFLAGLILLALKILPRLWRSLQLGLLRAVAFIWFLAGTAFLTFLGLGHLIAASSTIIVAELLTWSTGRISEPQREVENLQNSLDPDLPVQEGGTDLLDRGPIVDYLASIAIRERPTVIALTGNYGDGKTSVLNLVLGKLRKLEGNQRPIIVKFSPWLPGDSTALVSSLLSSIRAEIGREYMIPGLTQGARRYGRALLGAVPRAEALKELFSELSQEERIKGLTAEVSKMPRRIIVALDNLDRMEAKELETVFKILRGAEEFSSVTFLCCFDSRELSRILKSSRRFQNTKLFI
jgi:hypothetical protein